MYNEDEKLIPEISQEENAPLPPSDAPAVPVEQPVEPAPVTTKAPAETSTVEASPVEVAQPAEVSPSPVEETPAQPVVEQPAPAEQPAPTEQPAAPVEKPAEPVPEKKPAEPVKEEPIPEPATAEVKNDPNSVQSPGVQPHNEGFGTHKHVSSSRVVSELIEKTEVDGGSLFAFIGDGFDKINGHTINVYALVFGPFYLAYRKLKTQAFISMLIAWIIGLYFRNYIVIGVYLIMHGLFANGMIMNFARNQVKKIKSEHTSYSSGEITTMCMNAGRPSLGPVISTLIKATLVFIVFNYVLGRVGVVPTNNFAYKYPDKAVNYVSSKLNLNFDFKKKKEEEPIVYKTDFNGTIDYNPKSVSDVLNITKPETYNQISLDGADLIEYKHDNLDTMSMCDARIYGVLNYKDAIEYAKAVNKFYEGSELTVKSVNGINWYIFNYELNGKNTMYVSNNDNNEIYVYSFLLVGEDEYSDEELNILNSISYK